MRNGQHSKEIGEVSPTSLSHLLGQAGVKAQVSVGLEAAWADHRKFDHALLVGPPGVGKTTLAHILASEMATRCYECRGRTITSPSEFHALSLGAGDKDVIHIDEAHDLNREWQTALLLDIEGRKLFIGGKGRTPQAIPLCDFTLLLSTTDEYRLIQPLRDRMRLLLRFEFYSADELVEVRRQRSRSLGWSADPEVFSLIAERSRGTPRLALRHAALTGLRLHPHVFRHTMAHRFLADSQNDLVALAQILGHTNLNTTSRYTQRTADQLNAAAEALAY